MPFARLKLLLVCTLIASAALFAIGVAIERSHVETSVSGGEVSHTEGGTGGEGGGTTEGGSGEGSTSTKPVGPVEHTGDAVLLGVNLESWWLVGVAVLVSLGLALAIWFRPARRVLAGVAVFAIVFAAFDIAEVSHQVSASNAGLVAMASLVALLHLAAVSLALAAFRSAQAE